MPTISVFPEVESIADVTSNVFARVILPAGKPVLMRGLMAKWPAVAKGLAGAESAANYLKAMDNGRPTTVLEANNNVQGRFAYGPDMHDFNFNKRSKSISAGIDQILAALEHPNPPYTYVQSTVIPEYLPRFVPENPCPILPPAIPPRIWISNATRAQTHNDNDHNLACVIAGRRRFTLFPPEQLANLSLSASRNSPKR